MPIVYMVYSRDYEDLYLFGIFTTKEKAVSRKAQIILTQEYNTPLIEKVEMDFDMKLYL